MTPRVDVTAIPDDLPMEETAEVFRESGYSRLPVYHEDMDHIIGVLNEKDFYTGLHAGCKDVCQLIRPAVLAPATINISKLLRLFLSGRTHMVMLVDEYGGTEGLVTM